MRAAANPAWPALFVVACLFASAGCSPAAGPDTTPPPGSGCRDSGCPPGEECDGAGCVPVRPTLYSHIQLASVLFRSYVDDAEVEWRATHADLLIGRTVIYADRMRIANPNVRLFEYGVFRYYSYPQDAEAWAALSGYPVENFFLHYREDVQVPGYESTVIVPGSPPGVVPGWNPDWTPGDPPASATSREQSRAVGVPYSGVEAQMMANITNTGYRQFLVDQMERIADGTLYGAVNASGPVDGILVDHGVYYPIFNEGVIDKTSEFYGLPLDGTNPYALGFVTFYPELDDALASRMTKPIDLMPNFGDAFFLAYPDPLSEAVLAATDWVWAEVWVMFRGNSSPTSGSARAITYEQDYESAIATIVRQTRQGGRRVLGARDIMLAPSGSDRGRLFTLALYYLVHNANTFYQYESYNGHTYPVHVSEWQWNPAVTCDVGRPDRVPAGLSDFEGKTGTSEHYEFASGPDPYDGSLTYHVLARKFTKSLVLVKMLPRGSVVDDRSITVHALDRPYKVLHADGTLSAETVTNVSLRNNEGVILVLP